MTPNLIELHGRPHIVVTIGSVIVLLCIHVCRHFEAASEATGPRDVRARRKKVSEKDGKEKGDREAGREGGRQGGRIENGAKSRLERSERCLN